MKRLDLVGAAEITISWHLLYQLKFYNLWVWVKDYSGKNGTLGIFCKSEWVVAVLERNLPLDSENNLMRSLSMVRGGVVYALLLSDTATRKNTMPYTGHHAHTKNQSLFKLQLPIMTNDWVQKTSPHTSAQCHSIFLLHFFISSATTAAASISVASRSEILLSRKGVAELIGDNAFLNRLLSPSPHMGVCEREATLPALPV